MLSFFSGISGLFIGIANRISFLFFVLGLLLMVLSRNGNIALPGKGAEKLFKWFVMMYIICDITSIIMASVLYQTLGSIGGEDAIQAVTHKIPYSFMFILYIIYNTEVFSLLSIDEIATEIEKSINLCIVIGFIQIAVIYVGGPATIVNNIFNVLFNSWSSENIIATQRIALITTEPATIAGFLGAFVTPFFFSQWLTKGIKKDSIIKYLLVIVIMYFTRSTTGYALVFIELIIFFVVFMFNKEITVQRKIACLFFVFLLLVCVEIIFVSSSLVNDDVEWVLFDKLLNNDNTSTASRKVPLYVNWGIFKEYPILGVGNGNQGFFYQKYFPEWAHSSIWAENNFARSQTTLFDGALFFPSFLSGYGLVGVGLLIGFGILCVKFVRKHKQCLGYLYYFYLFAGIGVIIYGFSTQFNGEYWVWFILSIPFSITYLKTENEIEDELS